MVSDSMVTLFVGGQVLTMSDVGVVDALAIQGDRILALGSQRECTDAASHVDRVVELEGCCLMPGFVDPHTHPIMMGQVRGWVDCSPDTVASISDIIKLMENSARGLGEQRWLRGFGYEHRRLAEQRHPNRGDLDRVATDRPVMLMNASGHGVVVNSFGLATLGIDETIVDPQGGEIVRDAAGNPTGLLLDAACDLLTGADGIKVRNHGPNFHLDEGPDKMREVFLDAQEEFIRAGITTVSDMQVTKREAKTYFAAWSAHELSIRVGMYYLSNQLPDIMALGLATPFGDASLRLQGLKLYADGSLGAWTAYFPQGYLSDPCNHGHLYHQEGEYRELMIDAINSGLQTATHAQSPEAIQFVLGALRDERIAKKVSGGRHRIEHCGLPTDGQIAEMGALGVVPVGQPQHHVQFGDGTVEAIGAFGERYNPFGLYESAGIPVVLSSDAPVATPHPLAAVRAAHERLTSSGRKLGGNELAVSIHTALRGYTINSAWAMGREQDLGSLEKGKLADFTVLDRNPLAKDAFLPGDPSVLQTWIGGVNVFTS